MAQGAADEQKQQDPRFAGAVAAALAAGGATVVPLAPAAAGTAAPAGLAVGALLSARAVGELTETVVEQMTAFLRVRSAASATSVRAVLRRSYPERTETEVDDLIAEEMRRERVFREKMADRLRRDVPKALSQADPDARRDRLVAVLAREQRYVEMREEAMHDRAIARAEMLAVKEASPAGAYWRMSPLVRNHTPDCVALANKFWPWEVILAVGPPPRHHGCRCELMTLDEAVEHGLMDREQAAGVDVLDALRRAKKLLADAELLEHVVSQEEFEEWLDELSVAEAAETKGAMIAFYPGAETRRKLAGHKLATEPADQIHLTLVFLGPDATAIDDKRAAIRRAVRRAARAATPLSGKVGGLGMFAGDPKADARPLFATPDVPGLTDFRADLARSLGEKLMGEQTHGFTPHITLAYVPKADGQPEMSLPRAHPLDFSTVWLVWGGEREGFELGTGRKVEESEADEIAALVAEMTNPCDCGADNLPHEWGSACPADGPVAVEEAYVPLRYGKGVEHGGEFRPKLGGDPGRHLAKTLMRKLVPELPPTPRQAAKQKRGRHAHVEGRRVFVPEMRAFDRTIDGHRYTSPAFSTNLYRDGEPHDDAGPQAPRGEVRVASVPVDAGVAGRLDAARRARHGELGEQIVGALIAGKEDHPPVSEGADAHAADRALFDHGFTETATRRDDDGDEVWYRAPNGASELRLLLGDDGRVLESEWKPAAPVAPGKPLGRPARTWHEFAADVSSFARALAADNGHGAILGEVRVGSGDDFSDHAGEHTWNGDVILGEDTPTSLLEAASARARGADLTDDQARGVWASYQAAAHESLHAAVPFGPRLNAQPHHMALNEALVEELSHLEAARWLRESGQHDVLRWRANNPTAGKSLGSYVEYRHGLDAVLSAAKVAPEEREPVMRRLYFEVRPQDRYEEIGRMLSQVDGGAKDLGGRRAIDMMEANAGGDASFAPTLIPDLTPTGQARSPFQVGGKELRIGDKLGYTFRVLEGEDWKPRGSEGRVVALEQHGDGRWTANVVADDGTVTYGVLPQQIAIVERDPELPGGAPLIGRTFGAGADSVELPGGTVREGSLVRYDGRADGGYSTAKVVRVVRERNPAAPTEPGWIIEAVTTKDSLRPGTRVLLTSERVGGELATTGRAEHGVPGKGGLLPPAAPTLNEQARLAPYFRMDVPGTFVVPTDRLVPSKLDPPEKIEKAKARMHASASGAGGKRMPLTVHPTRDGRFVVLDGNSTLEVARSRGMRRLPAVLSAVAEVDSHLRAAQAQEVKAPTVAGAGIVEGLRRARQILAQGGGPEDVAREAFAHRGSGEAEDGFQTGMRAAYFAATESPRAAMLAEYKGVPRRRNYGGWGMGAKKQAGDDSDAPSWFQKKLGDWLSEKDVGGTGRTVRAPKPDVWDDSGTVKLGGAAGGSNGARFGTDADGRKWLVKTYKGDQDRVATELLANALYRELGVKVPKAGSLSFDGKPALAYPLVDGVPGGYKSGVRVERPSKALADGFMVDAFLANWDVVGMEHDNLLWPEGTTPETWRPSTEPVRLDQGGSLAFRAMGSRKPFGPVPSEVWTMASPDGGQAFGTMLLTDAGKREGARRIGELSDARIDGLVAAAPFADSQMRADVAEALKARRDWMREYGAGRVSEPRPLAGARARESLRAAQRPDELLPETEAALEAWGRGWDEQVNAHLRSHGKAEEASREVRFLVGAMDDLTRGSRTADPVTAFASLPERLMPKGKGGWQDLEGRVLNDPGFLGMSTSKRSADLEGAATVRVLVPAGARAAFLPGLPGHASGRRAELVAERGARLRVVRVVVEDGRVLIDAVLTR